MNTLGIILAGGKATRLFPTTLGVSKQLLAVYDKPMIYYPLSTLMLMDIRNFLIITSEENEKEFKRLFANCKEEFGINILWAVQPQPKGIAEAFKYVEELNVSLFYSNYVLILGDNLFYGSGFKDYIKYFISTEQANIFTHTVKHPEHFGVVEYDVLGSIMGIEEKPEKPKSNHISTGLYSYPSNVLKLYKTLSPSERGELEITDLNNLYLSFGELGGIKLPRAFYWSDMGTPESLLDTSNFIESIQRTQDVLVGSPHEIAFDKNWVDRDRFRDIIKIYEKTEYGKLLNKLLEK